MSPKLATTESAKSAHIGPMKTCSKCHKLKTLDSFHKATRGPQGRQWYCKGCIKQAQFESRVRASMDMAKIVLVDPKAARWGQMFPLLQGIATNGYCCGIGDKITGDTLAHSHNEHVDSEYGWICFRADIMLVTPDGVPTPVFLHEYAHLVIHEDGHTPDWRNAYKYLLKEFGYKWKGKINSYN